MCWVGSYYLQRMAYASVLLKLNTCMYISIASLRCHQYFKFQNIVMIKPLIDSWTFSNVHRSSVFFIESKLHAHKGWLLHIIVKKLLTHPYIHA